jgi:hypothetical protein
MKRMRNSYKIRRNIHWEIIGVDKRIIYLKEIRCDDIEWIQLDHEKVQMCKSLDPIKTGVLLPS